MIHRYTAVHDILPNKSVVLSGSAGKPVATFEGDDRVAKANEHAKLLDRICTNVLKLPNVVNMRIVRDDKIEVRYASSPEAWVDFMPLAQAISWISK